jgi:hypothetical protein
MQAPMQVLRHSSGSMVEQLGMMAGQALLAWLLLAIPAVVVLTVTLTTVFRRVPALATVRARD